MINIKVTDEFEYIGKDIFKLQPYGPTIKEKDIITIRQYNEKTRKDLCTVIINRDVDTETPTDLGWFFAVINTGYKFVKLEKLPPLL